MIGLASIGIVWWLWGHMNPTPFVHDEAAYLLQAEIFAAGACTAPAAPAPEFFEQFHVLVTPFIAAKYPPGHSLLLAMGARIGVPVLVPLGLVGLAAGLLFAIASRFLGRGDALLCWALWTVAPLNLYALATYLSELTSLVLGLAAWAALIRWWNTGASGWLIAVAGCVGWSAITRPLTALVWAVPIAIVVVARCRQTREFKGVLAAGLVGTALVALLPLWNRCTTGAWLSSPLGLYTESYMPWDRIGFGLDSTPPLRQSQPDLGEVAAVFRPVHAVHVPSGYFELLGKRMWAVIHESWGGLAIAVLPFAVVGLFRSRAIWLAGATVLLMVVAYSLYAHPLTWNVYYVEVLPVLAALPVLGVAWLRGKAASRTGLVRAGYTVGASLGFAVVAGAVLLGAARAPAERAAKVRKQAEIRRFRNMVSRLPSDSSIIFVAYSRDHDVHRSLVRNAPFLAESKTWIVYDRGDENARLLELAPNRAAYQYSEASRMIRPLSTPRR